VAGLQHQSLMATRQKNRCGLFDKYQISIEQFMMIFPSMWCNVAANILDGALKMP
jgi:hypothetical protein